MHVITYTNTKCDCVQMHVVSVIMAVFKGWCMDAYTFDDAVPSNTTHLYRLVLNGGRWRLCTIYMESLA